MLTRESATKILDLLKGEESDAFELLGFQMALEQEHEAKLCGDDPAEAVFGLADVLCCEHGDIGKDIGEAVEAAGKAIGLTQPEWEG